MLLQRVPGGVVKSLVIFHLTLQTVACAGDIYSVSMSGDLDIGLSTTPGVGCTFRQFKEAVHGYGYLYPALRNYLPSGLFYHCRGGVAYFDH